MAWPRRSTTRCHHHATIQCHHPMPSSRNNPVPSPDAIITQQSSAIALPRMVRSSPTRRGHLVRPWQAPPRSAVEAASHKPSNRAMQWISVAFACAIGRRSRSVPIMRERFKHGLSKAITSITRNPKYRDHFDFQASRRASPDRGDRRPARRSLCNPRNRLAKSVLNERTPIHSRTRIFPGRCRGANATEPCPP